MNWGQSFQAFFIYCLQVLTWHLSFRHPGPLPVMHCTLQWEAFCSEGKQHDMIIMGYDFGYRKWGESGIWLHIGWNTFIGGLIVRYLVQIVANIKWWIVICCFYILSYLLEALERHNWNCCSRCQRVLVCGEQDNSRQSYLLLLCVLSARRSSTWACGRTSGISSPPPSNCTTAKRNSFSKGVCRVST
jgi:hypothetical protein